MGKIYSRFLVNPFRNFNVEGRAHKIISRDKPTPAPKHRSDALDMDRLMKDYPEVYADSLKKNVQLDENLRNVFVQSMGQDPVFKKDSRKPLPSDRNQVKDFEYGVHEPKQVPDGKVTLKSALQFITDHQHDKKSNSAENIAKSYSVPEMTIKDVLHYCKVYEVYIPQERKTKAKFAGPSVPRHKIVVEKAKQLPAGSLSKEET